MAIQPLKFNINILNPSFKQKKEVKPYLEAEGAVKTDGLTHPLPPQGHLIHDNVANSVKYFFKDIGYDMKSIKNGLNGTANDHQLGRLNDVGLVSAGILIATYLASKTNNKKARIMEYVGLASFLTAMSIYPKIAINTPAKILHGFDIDKEYIDDQGRKKSVMQDSNYVPYDMYLGEIPEEDFAIIGDKMGIPRDIKNRNELIKEQMRKNATQSQTLWMLTAGVTPALSALMCYALENYVVAPGLEKAELARYNKAVQSALETTKNMSLDVKSIKTNSLAKNIESILSTYKGRELPIEEFQNIVHLLDEEMYANTSEGIVKDLSQILHNSAAGGKPSFVLTEESLDKTISEAHNLISKRHKEKLEKVLVPSKEEFVDIINSVLGKKVELKKGVTITADDIEKIKTAMSDLVNSKFASVGDVPKSFLEAKRNEIISSVAKSFEAEPSMFVSEESMQKIVDFAKVMGEFKNNQRALNKCKEFGVEFTNDTLIARSYGKFEQTLLKELNISFSDLKKMRESDKYTKELLDKKISELVKDENRYKKVMEKLGDIISNLDVKLNGTDEAQSRMLDLINAIEYNYNNTARRLSEIGGFESTIDKMVKQDVQTLSNRITTRTELFDYLDGIEPNKFKAMFEGKEWWSPNLTDAERIQYILENKNGKGSTKNLEITRIVERYQGAKNSLFRFLHTMDVYKRSLSPETFADNLAGKSPEYIDTIIKNGKEALLYASAPDHTMKLDTINNPNLYKDIMNSVWAGEAEGFWSTKQRGLLNEATKEALGKNNDISKGNLLDRFEYYITRFRNLVGNSDIDFTKPSHRLNPAIKDLYTPEAQTRMAIFNLVGQTPVDMAKGAASRRYATQKWVRIISAITGSVFGVALIAQFFFGKIKNPHNIQKQVSENANN